MKIKENISELRKICQGIHKEDFSAQIVRKVSIYPTWVCLKMSITANQVSIINILIGVLTGIVAAIDLKYLYLSIIFFWINTILDGVDGEVARYNRSTSLTGLFVDRINSIFIYPSFFLGVGWLLSYKSILLLLLGALVGMGMLMLRMLKTSIDTTVIDGIISKNKASQEKPLDFHTKNETFIHASEMIRSGQNVIFWIIDFILIRQPGMAIFISIVYIISLMFNSVLYFMSGLLVVYFILIYTAIFYGTWKIIKDSTVEKQYQFVVKIFG